MWGKGRGTDRYVVVDVEHCYKAADADDYGDYTNAEHDGQSDFLSFRCHET